MTLRIETFHSDLGALYAMMDEAWAADYRREPRLDYTPEFLRWHLDAPGSDPDLVVAAYDDNAPVGFGASFPRTMRLRGTPVQATLSTFFTVHAGYRRQRLGWRLVEERLRRNRERGIQCTFVYLQEGHASQPLYERLGRETGARVERVYRSAFRVRLLDPDRVSERARAAWGDAMIDLPAEQPEDDVEAEIRPLQGHDLARCRELLNQIQLSVPFGRIWESETELEWQLAHPPFSETLVMEVDGQVEGLLSWFVIDQIAKTKNPVAQLDHFWFGAVTENQRRALVAAALRTMANRGCVVATLSGPTYVDESVFETMGFVAFPTYLDLYAVVLDPRLDLSELDRIYLDQL